MVLASQGKRCQVVAQWGRVGSSRIGRGPHDQLRAAPLWPDPEAHGLGSRAGFLGWRLTICSIRSGQRAAEDFMLDGVDEALAMFAPRQLRMERMAPPEQAVTFRVCPIAPIGRSAENPSQQRFPPQCALCISASGAAPALQIPQSWKVTPTSPSVSSTARSLPESAPRSPGVGRLLVYCSQQSHHGAVTRQIAGNDHMPAAVPASPGGMA